MIAMNYMGISFGLLTYERGMTFSSSVNHFVYIIIIGGLLIFRLGGIPRKAAKLEERLKQKAAEQSDTTKKDQ
jgi:hypothetical protein